jgi:hypothetical protein
MQSPPAMSVENLGQSANPLDQLSDLKSLKEVKAFVAKHLTGEYRELFKEIAGEDIDNEETAEYLGYAAIVLKAIQDKKVNEILVDQQYLALYQKAFEFQEKNDLKDLSSLFDLVTFLDFLQRPTEAEKPLAEAVSKVMLSEDVKSILSDKELKSDDISKLEKILTILESVKEVKRFYIAINDEIIKSSDTHDTLQDVESVMAKQSRIKKLLMQFEMSNGIKLEIRYEPGNRRLRFVLTSASKLNQENNVENGFTFEMNGNQYTVQLGPVLEQMFQ